MKRQDMKQDLTLQVNGIGYDISVEPRKTLADALRDECGLTGTHLGCEHGVCGACTIMADGAPIRACLMFAKGNDWSPLQKAFVEHHGLQCGYCTPGFLMLATSALEDNPDISDADLRDVLSSNLCRCTGYENIVKAVRAAAADMGASS